MSALNAVRYHCRGVDSTYLFKVQENTIFLRIYGLAEKCIFNKTFSTLDSSFSWVPQLLDKGNLDPVIEKLVKNTLPPSWQLYYPIRKKVLNINEEALDQAIKRFKHQAFQASSVSSIKCLLRERERRHLPAL